VLIEFSCPARETAKESRITEPGCGAGMEKTMKKSIDDLMPRAPERQKCRRMLAVFPKI